MNFLTAAKTNHGKSWTAQAYIEENAGDYSRVVIMDYKDEYAGLVESGQVARLTAPRQVADLDVDDWRTVIRDNDPAGGLQVVRGGYDDETWRYIGADVVRAIAGLDETTYLVLDEAHRLAPQRGKFPDPYKTLATTWHGDGIGVQYVTQRLAELEETLLAQMQATLLGAFRSDADLDKVGRLVEYPVDVHNGNVSGELSTTLPSALQIDGRDLPLRRFEDDGGHTIGSEWVYSDGTNLERVDTRDVEMAATHYGSDRKRINNPF